MVIATKRTIKQSENKKLPTILLYRGEKIKERCDFTTFEIIITTRRAIYKNHVGYMVSTTPYAVASDGKAHEASLYAWLINLVNTQKAFRGHEKEQYLDSDITKGEILLTDKIITEANLTKPMAVFTNLDYATKAASEYIQWLNEQQKKLEDTMSEKAPEEDAKIDAEEKAIIENRKTVSEMIPDEIPEVK
jgi:hypothetical protein